jgi:hypothetical protein
MTGQAAALLAGRLLSNDFSGISISESRTHTMKIRGTTGLENAGFSEATVRDTRPPQLQQIPDNQVSSDDADQATTPASRLVDPLVNSLVKARLNLPGTGSWGTPASVPHPPGGANVLYTKGKVSSNNSPAPTSAGVNVPADVASLLVDGAKVKEANAEFTGAQKALAAGDYTKAYAHMESLMRKQGEEVLSEDLVKATQTVRDQLEVLSKMQKAGIKADYPPTEGQLLDYFKTLSNNPGAARQAFSDYALSFHAHPSEVPGAGDNIVYSKDNNQHNTHAPDSWSEVANRPSKHKAKHIGKQMNDCEGYAFMADKLLGAAGFRVAHHISVHPSYNDDAHSMVAFKHPKEKGFTVTSNHSVVHAGTEKEAAKEGYKNIFGGVTGKEHYYIGRTIVESQLQTVKKDAEL